MLISIKNIKKFSFFSGSDNLRMLFFQLINVKMPTTVGILTFMSRKNFVWILIETNVYISNELIFSYVYRSVNYIGSLAKFTKTPSGFIQYARDPM